MGVEAVVGRHQDQPGAFLSRLPGGQPGLDAEGAGLVGGGQDHGALVAAGDGDRLPAQGRVGLLFDRGEEGVHVDMHDDPLHYNTSICSSFQLASLML